jgi:hypothetical protein
MEYITDLILEAGEELKRLEHIIYVSLKYTRTVDVIINALNRLVGIYDLIIEAFLKKENGDEPLAKSPALRARMLAELFPDDALLQKHLHFYQFLKNVLKLPYTRRREFRRHVTLIVDMEGNCTAEVNIDNLTNCERFAHQLLVHSRKLVLGEKEKED